MNVQRAAAVASPLGQRHANPRSTKDFDPSELEDEAAYPAWELMGELGLTMCIQTGPIGLPQVTALAVRFPTVPIILDHLGRPDPTDGPPYAAAQSLFDLAAVPSIFLKLTPRIMGDSRTGAATPETFFGKLVSEFGANRIALAVPGGNKAVSPVWLTVTLATPTVSSR